MREQGVTALLQSGDATEIPPVSFDLYNLHKLVTERQPKTILEFGVGFSTLVLAHAVGENGHVWSVDASEHWIENTRRKIPEGLAGRVSLIHSPCRAQALGGALCHAYDRLPNIIPDMIYLDAPNPEHIEGSVQGLTFHGEEVGKRPICAMDPLRYESTLSVKRRPFMVVDGRWDNCDFLRARLTRNWRIRQSQTHKITLFELLP